MTPWNGPFAADQVPARRAAPTGPAAYTSANTIQTGLPVWITWPVGLS